jgi:hypothetical protein
MQWQRLLLQLFPKRVAVNTVIYSFWNETAMISAHLNGYNELEVFVGKA